MKHNHQKNVRQLEALKKDLMESIGEVLLERVEEIANDLKERFQKELSRVSISNEITKTTTQFFIPIEVEIDSWQDENKNATAKIDVVVDSQIASKTLTASWHGTGLHVNKEILKYIEEISGQEFKDIEDENGEVDPNKMSAMYFNPTYADIKFRDAAENEVKLNTIRIVIRQKQ
jgi:hypothetical protein